MPKITHIELFEHTERPVLSIRVKTSLEKLPDLIGESFDKISDHLEEMNENMSDMPFVAYENFEEMKANDLSVIIGIPVSGIISGKNEIELSKIPAGKTISCMYRGAYSEISSLYEEMRDWIYTNGYEPEGNAYEFYYNGLDFPPCDYLTRVMIPVKRAENS